MVIHLIAHIQFNSLTQNDNIFVFCTFAHDLPATYGTLNALMRVGLLSKCKRVKISLPNRVKLL